MESYIVGWLWKDSSKFISLNKQGTNKSICLE
ncbi:unnamed protein product [Brugia timori]|uniref:Uncharacterized protein n=1 Tax=Brugia timori TaxID=42155 RepID=A0A0R3QWN3_9BILA|nr:unnamed protein product [Brugia timori]